MPREKRNISIIIEVELLEILDSVSEEEKRNRSKMLSILLSEALTARNKIDEYSLLESEEGEELISDDSAKEKYGKKRVGLSVPLDAYEKLEQIAKEEQRSITNLCLSFVLEKLEEVTSSKLDDK